MKSPFPVGPGLCALSLLALLVACGGPAPELGLSGPSSAKLLWGDTQTLELAIERNGSVKGDLVFSVDGLPAGVTARFEPETIAGDASSATLHLEAASDAAAAAALVTIRATGADALVAEHILLLEVSGLTVSGVVEPFLGPHVGAGIGVKVGTHWVATDHEGRFVAHNVSVPYDLVLQGALVTEVYQGLTTPTPRVTGFISTLDGGISTTTGSLEVTLSPTPQLNETITLCPSVPYLTADSCRKLYGNGFVNSVVMDIEFHGSASDPRHLVARREQIDPVSGHSLGFTGHGSVAIPFAPEATVALNLNLSTSTSDEIPFVLELPEPGMPAMTTGHVTYGARLNGHHYVGPDVFFLPQGAGGVLAVAVEDPATKIVFATLQPITGPLDGPITFAPALQDVSPAPGASITSSTEFRAHAPEGGLVTHLFAAFGGNTSLLMVHTFEDSVRVSDLEADLGPLNVQDFEEWLVFSTPHLTTPEQAIEQLSGYFAFVSAMGTIPVVELPAAPTRLSVSVRDVNTAAGPSALRPGLERLEALLER